MKSTGNKENLKATIGAKAKEFGMTKLAKVTGIPREHLYKILSEKGNPTLNTLYKICGALCLKLELKK